VVDDHASAREILVALSLQLGLIAEAEAGGAEALQRVQQAREAGTPFDFVLIDWKMPGMDGLTTLQALQGRWGESAPQALLITSYDRDQALRGAGAANVTLKGVLSKPLTVAALRKALLAGDQAASGADSANTEPDGSTVLAALVGARVLLVEDNDMNQELATELLNAVGIEVVLAENGQVALDRLASDTAFDAVLMDCQMPVMDGYTATTLARQRPELSHLPFIAMTANAMQADRERAFQAGMCDHISKPIDPPLLTATLARWIQARPKAAGAPAGASSAQGTADGPSEAAQPAEPGAGGLFDQLCGIDVALGLRNTLQRPELLLKQLRRFRQGQLGFGDRYRQAIERADFDTATRLAHTLKGTAGTIGAVEVQARAKALEDVSTQGAAPTELRALLEPLLYELESVLQSLARLDEGNPPGPALAQRATPPPPASAQEQAKIETLWQHLLGLMAESDGTASDVLQELSALPISPDQARRLNAAAGALSNFDFDRALELMKPDATP
jgi:CheY-like chemotaxis protein/HPt (histidine-containing phosphotransfer) domain-containing protein